MKANEYAQTVLDMAAKGNCRKVIKCVVTSETECQVHLDDGSHVTLTGGFACEIKKLLAGYRGPAA